MSLKVLQVLKVLKVPFEVLQTADISLVSNMHDPPATPEKAKCHAALVPLVPSFILLLHVS